LPEKLIIIGCGAQARYIINTVNINHGLEIIGLVDTFNNPAIWGTEIDGVRVLGNMDILRESPPTSDLQVITAIAGLENKRKIVGHLITCGYTFFSAIHPSVSIASWVEVGHDTIINAHVTIETGTSIGDHVIIHAGSVIEHDNIIGDFANIGPGVVTAGRVRINNGAIVYTGASIIPDVEIGEDAVVGAGAVVTKCVEPRTTVIGVPARPISPGKDL